MEPEWNPTVIRPADVLSAESWNLGELRVNGRRVRQEADMSSPCIFLLNTFCWSLVTFRRNFNSFRLCPSQGPTWSVPALPCSLIFCGSLTYPCPSDQSFSASVPCGFSPVWIIPLIRSFSTLGLALGVLHVYLNLEYKQGPPLTCSQCVAHSKHSRMFKEVVPPLSIFFGWKHNIHENAHFPKVNTPCNQQPGQETKYYQPPTNIQSRSPA